MSVDMSNKEAISARNWHPFFMKGIETFIAFHLSGNDSLKYKHDAIMLDFRAELEATYAKGLSKLSSKLTKACAKDQGD